MRMCAALPLGDRLYRGLQRTVGRLRAGDDPRPALRGQVELARWLRGAGRRIEGSTLLEVGTGHLPLVPVGFFLCGAARVVTIDLHRRLQPGLLGRALRWLAGHPEEVLALTAEVADRATVEDRLARLARWSGPPEAFLEEAGIKYLAPADAAQTGLPAGSVDAHFSRAVLEHVTPPALRSILDEARRLLGPEGAALHFIDLHDHFHGPDPTITRIHFLRYSEEEWLALAGNEFAYCNRLRLPDLLEAFREAGFDVLRHEGRVDPAALAALGAGFPVHERFRGYPPNDLCAIELKVLARPGPRSGGR